MISIGETLERGALDELNFSFAPQAAIFAALKLGVFEAMAEEAKDAESLASATCSSPRGARMLLDFMSSIGLVEKEDRRYGLNDLSRDYFLPSGKNYLGSLFICSDRLVKLWLSLPDAVRTGKPPLSTLPENEREELNLDIAEALFQVHRSSAWKLAALFEKNLIGQRIKILDVGAGSAVWSIPFALQSKGAEVTAVDFPPVLELTKKFVGKFGLLRRYQMIAGDIRKIVLGTEDYDLALLGHICHSEGAAWTQRLIRSCFRALKKNGTLLIMDYFPDEERKSARMPLLIALNALLGTEEGGTFTFAEYRRWILSAGFSEIQLLEADERCPVIAASKNER